MEKVYRPHVKDPRGLMKKRTQAAAKKFGLRVDQIQSKIYETGLAVYERMEGMQS